MSAVMLNPSVKPSTQTCHTILMVEPVAFAYNAATAGNNHFQRYVSAAQPKALAEFRAMVTRLRQAGVEVITIKDALLPPAPDAIFPNHAVSFHMVSFESTHKSVIVITEQQMCRYAGNARQVATGNPEMPRILVMSTGAYRALSRAQHRAIEKHCPILHTDLTTIEQVGGASAGAMMAEIFLPERGD